MLRATKRTATPQHAPTHPLPHPPARPHVPSPAHPHFARSNPHIPSPVTTLSPPPRPPANGLNEHTLTLADPACPIIGPKRTYVSPSPTT
eukprot:350895-Chlamydomonas_euryale.AAC.3